MPKLEGNNGPRKTQLRTQKPKFHFLATPENELIMYNESSRVCHQKLKCF